MRGATSTHAAAPSGSRSFNPRPRAGGDECAQGTWGPEDESAYRQLTGDPKLCTECLHHRADRADDDLSPCAVVPGQPIGAARAECDGALWEVDLAAIGVHDKQTEDVGP